MNSRPQPLIQRRRLARGVESLENRNLLAGVINVEISGDSLILTGDRFDNGVHIDVAAETVNEAILGMDGTSINLSSNANGFQMSEVDDLNIRMRGGDDTVVIDSTGRGFNKDLTAKMGAGDDLFAMLGSPPTTDAVSGDAKIYGHRGDDILILSEVQIGESLLVTAGRGQDVIAIDNSEVLGRSFLSGRRNDDAILINNSSLERNLTVAGGHGDDTIGMEQTHHGRRLLVPGQSGNDTLMANEVDVVARRYRDFSIEVRPTGQAAEDACEKAVAPLIDWLFTSSDSLDLQVAHQLHDAIANVSQAFNVEIVSLELDPESQTVSVADPTPSISVIWDQAVQQAVVNTGPGPTIASRAYAMMHTAMFDAWSAYDGPANSTRLLDNLQRPQSENTMANKMEAMSYAAYHVLEDLFATETELFDDVMDHLGFDPTNVTTDPSTAAGIGNLMAEALLNYRHADGSNQLGNDPAGNGEAYSDISGYQPVNSVGKADWIDAWTPEHVPIDSDPTDDPDIQSFLTPHWGDVDPFALESGAEFRPVAPEPFLLVDGTYDLTAKTITLSDGTVLDIQRGLIGDVINPAFIDQAIEVIDYSANLTDEQKLIAEFWEDGGGTSFPPGTFMTFAQFVSGRDNHTLDEDAELFFAMGNAAFDAGIATWEAKVHYDYARPVRVIRDLGELGLIGTFNADLGGFAIQAWTPDNGTQTILATDFLTYQTPGSDPSPPFAEYTSGHSAFSAAGATILSLFTGSNDFGASVTFPKGSSRFEPGITPNSEVTLSWDTFTAAADEAGLSRLYGGIHFTDGDVEGRTLGANVANKVWEQVQKQVNGQP